MRTTEAATAARKRGGPITYVDAPVPVQPVSLSAREALRVLKAVSTLDVPTIVNTMTQRQNAQLMAESKRARKVIDALDARLLILR